MNKKTEEPIYAQLQTSFDYKFSECHKCWDVWNSVVARWYIDDLDM